MGDFIESALARGYNDAHHQWVLAQALSDVVDRVCTILTFIREEGQYEFDLHNIQGAAPSVRENATKYGVALFYAVRVHYHGITLSNHRWQEYCKLADDLKLVNGKSHRRS